MSKNFEGALWALLTTAMFAIAIAMSKMAANDYHVLQILFFRQSVILISVLPVIIRTFPSSLMTRHPVQHLIRLTGAFASLSIALFAVTELPLTTVTVLMFSTTFFVSILAALILKEKIGLARIFSVVAGFVGVVIVVRPSFDSFSDLISLAVLCGAFGAACAIICVRRLTQVEPTTTLLVYQALFIGVIAGVPMFWIWQTPDFEGLMYLLAIGAVSTVAQWTGIHALKLGEASVVSSLRYTEIVYASVLGFWLFSEVPDTYTIGGAIIIIGSALFIIHRESRIKSA